MGRSRSRSPVLRRDRRRSLSRERDRRRERRRSRSRSRSPRRRRRSRSRSPRRRRSRSNSPRGHRIRSLSPEGSSKDTSEQPSRPVIDESQLEGKSEEEIEMMKMMGFGGFDSTKGKHVAGSNNASFVSIQPKRKYRQYMNRRGGFNRPLDFIA